MEHFYKVVAKIDILKEDNITRTSKKQVFITVRRLSRVFLLIYSSYIQFDVIEVF